MQCSQPIAAAPIRRRREVLVPGAGYTRLILPLMPRATGAVQARPGWFELLPLMDMDRMQACNAVNRQLQLAYEG